ncbi:DUF924 family protein [Shewanella sp. 0m-4]
MNTPVPAKIPAHSMTPDMIIHFWFEEIEPKQWWIKDLEFDALIEQRYADLLAAAMQGELYHWRTTPEGRLAEIIVLDQFSRNIYRGTPQSFAADPIALVLAQEAVALKIDSELKGKQVPFLFMPYMHSESSVIHEVALRLFGREAAQGNLDFEIKHKAIIDQFGRYPHRNAILKRESTAEEIAFLQQPGSSF